MNTAESVLGMLREKDKVSGEAIAKALKVSRTAVWKAMNGLRDLGYVVDGDHKGYHLVSAPDLLHPFELRPILRTRSFGKRIEHHMTIGSTNERARELAEEGWPDGSVVVSEAQETGKGRLGRGWSSPRGGIWFSLILTPDLRPNEAPTLTLSGGTVVAEALVKAGFDAKLKWPNDVLIGDKKVCGILTEMSGEMERIDYIVMGIGINANCKVGDLPKEIRAKATTLFEVKGTPVDRKGLFADILLAFEDIYDLGPDEIISRWKKRSATLGRMVRIHTQKGDIEGMARDLDATGALILELASGERQIIYSGDCEHLKIV
jgi:BirA family biotin operon repressor/biotin-[acetyl-CoA-carboxylase] ligase